VIIRITKIVALFVALILVIGASAYFTLTLIIKSEDTVVVPDLNRKEIVYVLEILTDLGLNTKVKGSEYSPGIPKNHVIFQEPEPGTEIKKGRDVRIILSKGTRNFFMPNLKGLSVQQARILIEENGLCQGKVSGTFSTEVEKDVIMAQVPSPGVMITRGRCINLLVSIGIRPQAYMMPDLIGLSLDEAILLIESRNLILGEIKSLFDEDRPQNVITDQEPLSGYRVIDGSIADIVITRKPDKKERDAIHGVNQTGLFRYRLKSGFLKRHIRVRLNSFGISSDIFDDYIKPGEEIWLILPRDGDATLLLYEDGKLIKTEYIY